MSTGASRGGGRLRGRVSIVQDGDWETEGTSATPTLPPQLRMVTLKVCPHFRLPAAARQTQERDEDWIVGVCVTEREIVCLRARRREERAVCTWL